MSTAIAQLLNLQFPIYALVAAVIVTDLEPSQTRRLGLTRIMATVVGAMCGATLSPILPPGPIAIGISILIAMLICQISPVRDGAKAPDYTCAIVVLNYSEGPWEYAFFRLLRLFIVAWAISYVPKLIRADEP